MIRRISVNSIYSYIIIILILVAVAIRGGASFEWLKPSDKPLYSLHDIQKAFPEANTFELMDDNSLAVFDKHNKTIGYALVSEDLNARYQGYAGIVPLIIALEKNYRVKAVFLLKNNETSEFIDHVNDVRLLDHWNNMPMDTTLLAMEVDVVSGATKSSQAIIRTFQYTAGNYLHMEKQEATTSLVRIIQVVLMFTLVVLSLSMSLKKRYKKIYTYYLLLVFIVLGLWLKKMLSLELFENWLTKGLPWQSNWELIIILLLAIAMAVSGHKKYYCNYMCPMGALQVLITKISPFKKRSLSIKISSLTLRTIYLSFIWASLVLGFTMPLAKLEPFMAFSFKVASCIMLSTGGLIIIMSLFFNRPWCQLCPTGCLLDSIPSIKSKYK